MIGSSSSKISTPVKYRPAPFQPTKDGVLEWTQDDQVRLIVDNKDGTFEVIVEVPVERIQEFKVFRTAIYLQIDTVTYVLETMSGPVIGLLAVFIAEKKARIQEWVRMLREKGVVVRYFGIVQILKISFIVTALFIALSIASKYFS